MLDRIATPTLDEAIAVLAARRYGVVATRQLVALGITKQAVSLRAGAGRLHRLHRGVHAVGHPVLTVRGHWMAAVLAAGDDAALSFASAAAHWDLRTGVPSIIDVSVPRTDGRPTATSRPQDPPHRPPPRRRGHRRARRDPRHDAGADDPRHGGHPQPDAPREPPRPGRAPGADRPPRPRCHRPGPPRPWRSERAANSGTLTVEADSWRFHKTRRDFENDRARDALLAAAGYRTLRFTDRQIARRPATVAAAIRAAAGAATARRGGAP